MKKLFAIVAVMGALIIGSTQMAQAQDAPGAEQVEQTTPAVDTDDSAAALAVEEGGIHKEIKTKFIVYCFIYEFSSYRSCYWFSFLY